MVKPINVFLILSGIGLASSLLLGAVGLVLHDRVLFRIAGVVFGVAYGIACIPLITVVIYLAVLRVRRSLGGGKKTP